MISDFIPPLFGSRALRVEAWNGLVALAGEALPIGEAGATASFELGSPPSADAWIASFRLTADSAPIFVHIRDFPFAGLFGVELGVSDIAGLPDGLRTALLDGMFGSIRNLLPPRFRDASPDGQGLAASFPGWRTSSVQWFEVRLARADGAVIALDVGADRSLAAQILSDDLLATAGARGTLAARIALPAAITLGGIELSVAELQRLESGAVIVLPAGAEARIAIRVDTVLYRFEKTAEAWRCLGGHRENGILPRSGANANWGTEMTDGGTAAEAPVGVETEGAISPTDLRLAVDFDIGHLDVPVATLSQWQPGALVELGTPATENGVEVTIRVNGDVIGQGDLVRIDDRLAVRINRLLLASKG